MSDLLFQVVMLPSISIEIPDCDVFITTHHVETIHSSKLIGQEQVSLPSWYRELGSIPTALTVEGFSMGSTTLAAMSHIKNMLVLFKIGLHDFSETHTSVS